MTNVLLIQPILKPLALRLLSNTPYSPGRSDRVKSLKTWRGEPMPHKHELFPDKLVDLHGHPMRVVTFHFPPRIFMEEDSDGNYNLYGVDIEVVRSLSKALNFTVSFVRPSDGEMWGWEQGNGTWTGLMGDLQHRKADIGVADLYIMEPYFAIIDMSLAYDIEYLCFVNPVPGPLPQWMALGLPFLVETWGAIFCTVLVGMLVFTLLAQMGFLGGHLHEAPWFQNGSNTCLLLVACVMNTAWTRVPTTSHLRIFMALWSLAFVILAVAYKGSLVSYLTVTLEQPPIDTHKQLLERGVSVGSIGDTLKRIMEKNADQHVRKLAQGYEQVQSTSEGLRRTVEGEAGHVLRTEVPTLKALHSQRHRFPALAPAGSFSFLESRGFLDYTIAVDYTDGRGRASLHAMKEYIAPFGIGLAYPKYVPFIAKFNRMIRRLTEAGLAEKYMADIILRRKQAKIGAAAEREGDQKERLGSDPESGVTPLSLDNLQGGFILLALGYGLGLLSAMAEGLFALATRPSESLARR
ncbi:glutamate receptor ionotropic, delta-2-like [Penaeus chinensis]|uniref:glutamate receptor ionotropic, delta-2-like n=1 Tax=Penaeus chinensis TaxID=139456 RepID=UPI001FB79CA5|nr:glutamate receptor ionotropic, delta-2-like [Penaeus chinensis]